MRWNHPPVAMAASTAPGPAAPPAAMAPAVAPSNLSKQLGHTLRPVTVFFKAVDRVRQLMHVPVATRAS